MPASDALASDGLHGLAELGFELALLRLGRLHLLDLQFAHRGGGARDLGAAGAQAQRDQDESRAGGRQGEAVDSHEDMLTAARQRGPGNRPGFPGRFDAQAAQPGARAAISSSSAA